MVHMASGRYTSAYHLLFTIIYHLSSLYDLLQYLSQKYKKFKKLNDNIQGYYSDIWDKVHTAETLLVQD